MIINPCTTVSSTQMQLALYSRHSLADFLLIIQNSSPRASFLSRLTSSPSKALTSRRLWGNALHDSAFLTIVIAIRDHSRRDKNAELHWQRERMAVLFFIALSKKVKHSRSAFFFVYGTAFQWSKFEKVRKIRYLQKLTKEKYLSSRHKKIQIFIVNKDLKIESSVLPFVLPWSFYVFSFRERHKFFWLILKSNSYICKYVQLHAQLFAFYRIP